MKALRVRPLRSVEQGFQHGQRRVGHSACSEMRICGRGHTVAHDRHETAIDAGDGHRILVARTAVATIRDGRSQVEITLLAVGGGAIPRDLFDICRGKNPGPARLAIELVVEHGRPALLAGEDFFVGIDVCAHPWTVLM
jgi:hypothetical protein